MNWIVIIGISIIVSIIGGIIFRFIWDLKKDNSDLSGQSFAEKFKVIVDTLNLSTYHGRGKVIPIDKIRFSLYEDGQNQIIHFAYTTGHLTILWKYKYFHNEVEHEKTFHNVRDLSYPDQKRIAEEMINEMAKVVEKHKKNVLESQGIKRPITNDSVGRIIDNKNDISDKNDKLPMADSFTDPRDGNVYKTIKVGDQIWFAENLRYIPHISPPSENKGIWVYNYNGHDVNEAISTMYYKEFGCLYDWETAKKVCPKGWHVPTVEEWTILTDYLGGNSLAGGKLKSLTVWKSPNRGATNGIGFSGLPGGCRSNDGMFGDIGEFGSWLTATENEQDGAYNRTVGFNGSDVYGDACYKKSGYSLRCLKD